MAFLILVRHGQSEWNKKGLWTGWTDIPLSQEGKEEAEKAAEAIRNFPIDVSFTSELERAQQTQAIILENLNLHIPTIHNRALNERNYGDFTGKNKWEIQKHVGEDEFLKIRRSYDYPIPNGESLKDVYQRTVPYYEANILPKLKNGKNVLVSAHGNSLRALVKYLENITDENIAKLEMATGEIYVYELDQTGKIVSKQALLSRPNTV